MTKAISAIAIALLSTAACQHDVVYESNSSQTEVCIQGEGTANIVYPDRPIQIVAQTRCSSTCIDNVVSRCNSFLNGNNIHVDTLFAFDLTSDVCTLECGRIETSCSLPTLGDGTYTVHHGDVQTTLKVGEPAPACL